MRHSAGTNSPTSVHKPNASIRPGAIQREGWSKLQAFPKHPNYLARVVTIAALSDRLDTESPSGLSHNQIIQHGAVWVEPNPPIGICGHGIVGLANLGHSINSGLGKFGCSGLDQL